MAILNLGEMREHLTLTDEIWLEDKDLLERLIDGAQNHIERLLGFKIEDCFGGEDQDPIPPSLVEAVSLLAAWWYDQRETALTGTIVVGVPFGVQEIINEYREFTF